MYDDGIGYKIISDKFNISAVPILQIGKRLSYKKIKEYERQKDTRSWRKIKGFNDRYMVSSDGHIKDAARRTQPLISLSMGYPRVSLSYGKDGTGISKKVHTLVSEAFLGEKPLGM